jgi:hypothetical protein
MPDGPVRGVVWGAVAPAAVVLAAGGVLLTALCLPMPMREGGRVACMVVVQAKTGGTSYAPSTCLGRQ